MSVEGDGLGARVLREWPNEKRFETLLEIFVRIMIMIASGEARAREGRAVKPPERAFPAWLLAPFQWPFKGLSRNLRAFEYFPQIQRNFPNTGIEIFFRLQSFLTTTALGLKSSLEKATIPCFVTCHRGWRGIASAVSAATYR